MLRTRCSHACFAHGDYDGGQHRVWGSDWTWRRRSIRRDEYLRRQRRCNNDSNTRLRQSSRSKKEGSGNADGKHLIKAGAHLITSELCGCELRYRDAPTPVPSLEVTTLAPFSGLQSSVKGSEATMSQNILAWWHDPTRYWPAFALPSPNLTISSHRFVLP
jgi:hypothetical protein